MARELLRVCVMRMCARMRVRECACACACGTVKFFFSFLANRTAFVDLIRFKSIWHLFFQLLDTLPVCQDFNRQVCNRPACKFIHLSDGE